MTTKFKSLGASKLVKIYYNLFENNPANIYISNYANMNMKIIKYL